MNEVTKIWFILEYFDPKKRQMYDQYGEEGVKAHEAGADMPGGVGGFGGFLLGIGILLLALRVCQCKQVTAETTTFVL